MKPAIYIIFIAMLIIACSTAKQVSKTSAEIKAASPDSTVYELIITDIHFDQWYLLNYNDARDRNNDYYRSKNITAVYNWNDLYRRGRYLNAIDSYINYEPHIDYGIEVNRKLYWYFKFVEDYYGIRLFY